MEQTEFFTLGRAWTGVSDHEFFWEPAPDTWSVRPRAQCRSEFPLGTGDWAADFGRETKPAQLTSIAWQAWHVGSLPQRLCETELFGGPHTMASGWTSPSLTHHPMFTTAHDAASAFHHGWEALRSALQQCSDGDLQFESPDYTYAYKPISNGLCVLGPPGLVRSASFFVARALNEVIHHSALICSLRDHYAHRVHVDESPNS